MSDLYLSVIHDGESYQSRLSAAFSHIAGETTGKEFNKAIREICQAAASKENRTMGTKHKRADVVGTTMEVCDYMLTHAKEFFYNGSNVRAVIRRWFDKPNGNSYFSATVTVQCEDGEERQFYIPMQYGYGNHPQYVVWEECIARGILPDPGRYPSNNLKGYISENGITYTDMGYGLKRDL